MALESVNELEAPNPSGFCCLLICEFWKIVYIYPVRIVLGNMFVMRPSHLLRVLKFCPLMALLLSLAAVRPGFAQSTNNPLSVSMVLPTNGAVFQIPLNLQLMAKAVDTNSGFASVTFFAGTNKLTGDVETVVLDPPGVNGVTGPVEFLTWSNVPPGLYALTAVAMDNQGASATSAVVNITVQSGPSPEVRITSPANRATFHAPMDLPIFAYARATYPGASSNLFGSLTNIEFFAGTNDLGAGQRVAEQDPNPEIPLLLLLNDRFVFQWTNAPPGSYALTAVAADDHGVMATSEPVNVTILPSLADTNGPNVISIVASDPVAIEGTNSWVWLGVTNATPAWSNWQTSSLTPFTSYGPKDAVFTVHRAMKAPATRLCFPIKSAAPPRMAWIT